MTDVIVSCSTSLLGTAYATVLLLDVDRRSVRFLRLEPVPDEVARLMAKIPPSAPSATGDALSTRRPLFHRTLAEYLSDYPHLRAATEALGVRALAHLPLVAGGDVMGLLSLSWSEEQRFEPGERWDLDLGHARRVLGYEPRSDVFDHLPVLWEQVACAVP